MGAIGIERHSLAPVTPLDAVKMGLYVLYA